VAERRPRPRPELQEAVRAAVVAAAEQLRPYKKRASLVAVRAAAVAAATQDAEGTRPY